MDPINLMSTILGHLAENAILIVNGIAIEVLTHIVLDALRRRR